MHKGAELIDLRLPSNINNSIRLVPERFDPTNYKIENPVRFKDEKGMTLEK